ncbi:MAG TPA: hypothetical protein DEB24_08530 [Coriobacteriia bacterium]|nr:hypothetical protein [Coriobacteriia bacterium]
MTCEFNGDTEIFYCNILFAGAVAKTTTESNAWGTADAPYQVRHADQLWSYLPRVYSGAAVSLENAYRAGHFEQTHSFDMTGYQNLDNPKKYPIQDNWLTGSYDGNDYAITGYHLTGMTYDTNSVNTSAQGGLFPRVWGGTIKNVRLLNGASGVTVTTGVGITRMGLLAGHVYGAGAVIENCSVENFDVTVILGNVEAYDPRIGGLIGHLDTSAVVKNCSVDNVRLAVDTGTASARRGIMDIGTFMGTAWPSVTVEGCSVTNSKLDVTLQGNAITYPRIGGFIGHVYLNDKINNCSAANIQVKVEVKNMTSTAGVIPDLEVGGFFGRVYEADADGCTLTDGKVEVAVKDRVTYPRVGGFIGNLEAGTSSIKNSETLRTSVSVSAGADNAAISALGVGGFAGRMYGAVTLDTCKVIDGALNNIEISDAVEHPRIGGCVGNAEAGAQIKNSEIAGLVLSVATAASNKAMTHLDLGGFIGRAFSTVTVDNSKVVNGVLKHDFNGSGSSKPRQRFGGFIGDAQSTVRVSNSHVIGGSLTVDVTDATALTQIIDAGGFLGRSGGSTVTLSGCSVKSSATTGNRFAIEILGASYSGSAAGNKVFNMRVGGLVGSSYYCTLTSNTVDGVNMRVTAPEGRLVSPWETKNYAGFGGLAGYLYNSGLTHKDNNVSNIGINMDWVGSREGWVSHSTDMKIAIGKAYGFEVTRGTITGASYGAGFNQTLIDSNGALCTDMIPAEPGIIGAYTINE